MAKYHGITTDAGTVFEVGKKSIEEISDEVVQGVKTGWLLIYKKETAAPEGAAAAETPGNSGALPAAARANPRAERVVLHARVDVTKTDTLLYTK